MNTISDINFSKNISNHILMIGTSWSNYVDTLKNFPHNAPEELENSMELISSVAEKCNDFNFSFLFDNLNIIYQKMKKFTELSASNQLKETIEIEDLIKNLIVFTEKPKDFDTPLPIPNKNLTTNLDLQNVYIFSNDISFFKEISTQINYYGFKTFIFDNLDNMIANIEKTPISIFLLDYDFLINSNITFSSSLLIDKKTQHTPLIINLSSKDDFNTRLNAVRLGANAFLVKPSNFSTILDTIDDLISFATDADPYRILVLDDSLLAATYVKKTLSSVGMSVLTEKNPENILSSINDFNPDLILMDMYMPKCNGQEVSKIIRQCDSLIGIPIVFLSSESDIRKQLSAMNIGADDFLNKSIPPDHLIASVTTRVKRHRALCSLMNQDSLTGLLNHTKIKQSLYDSVSKAKRVNIPISFIMVDIDKFKNVNDTYGHPVGDRVIKSLSRLLQNRLRKTDTVGRYGGEEFAVILWDTQPEEALNLINEIREDFYKIEQTYEKGSFHCSFSAGIASFPLTKDAQKISVEADQALYLSKTNGRNCVTLFEK